MEKLVLVPYKKYQRLLDGKTIKNKMPNPPKRCERTVPENGINRALRRATPLKTGSRSELRKKNTRKPQYRLLQICVRSIHERP